MKKSYLMIAAAVLTFAACSNNDVINEIKTIDQDVAIGFAQSAIDKTTRAELTMGWFRTLNNDFGVYGYKNDDNIFKNEQVICTTAAAPYEWTHATIRFWDKSATEAYDFYAYAPFTGTNNVAGTNPTFDKSSGFTFTNLSIIQDITADGADKAVANSVENVGYASNKLHNNGSYTTTSGTVNVTDHTNAPTVPFIFNHILSKLSFKVKTDAKAWDYTPATDAVATFTVTDIKIDFPTATGVEWAETNSSNPAGTTEYGTYTAKDGTYETDVFVGTDSTRVVTNTAAQIGKTFIVTPVNATQTKHEFGIQVTYNVKYKDGTTETGCVATGVIGTGTPATNVYTPAQNQHYIVTINLNPNAIEFCVEGVNAWTAVTGTAIDVK